MTAAKKERYKGPRCVRCLKKVAALVQTINGVKMCVGYCPCEDHPTAGMIYPLYDTEKPAKEKAK